MTAQALGRRHSAAPLVQRGDSMAQPCRGDCEADCIILLGCVAQRGSAVWVQRHAACRARERSMGAQALGRRHSAAPLVQRGDSMAKPCPDCRKTYITKRVVRPTPINPQKAATCAWLFALLKGQVCAKGVHAAPCKNSKKWLRPLFRHAQHGKAMQGGLWSQVDPIGFSAALGTGGDPAWGAKKVGEVPCRDSHTFFALRRSTSPARQRSMGAAARRYFVLRRNNTLPRPKIPLWGFWSSSPQRRLWLLGGANLGRWEIKCSWAHRGVSP